MFHIPFWRKSFIFGESITIPQHLLDQKCLEEYYPQSLSNSSLQNVQLNKCKRRKVEVANGDVTAYPAIMGIN
ncbi:hypothetical protein C0J52_27369 [Blattella germanica]|nr:hypothetical protein C0J52_27369 [Blattella germanica]